MKHGNSILGGFSLTVRGVRLAGLLVLLASRAIAVDPPPAEIESSSLETVQAYLERVGEDSDQLRRQVAQRRYEERRRYRQDVWVTMYGAAQQRRDLLLLQALAPSESASAPGQARAGAPTLASRFLPIALVGLALALIYGFRHRLFRRFYA